MREKRKEKQIIRWSQKIQSRRKAKKVQLSCGVGRKWYGKVIHLNGRIVSKSVHLISLTIRTALVSGNSKLNFYYPNMINITIRHKIYCLFDPRILSEKEKLSVSVSTISVRI
jgi:hypothetical protein